MNLHNLTVKAQKVFIICSTGEYVSQLCSVPHYQREKCLSEAFVRLPYEYNLHNFLIYIKFLVYLNVISDNL